MAVQACWFGVPIKNQYDGTSNGTIDFDTDTMKVALTTTNMTSGGSGTTAQDTWDFFDDADDNELATAGGYTAGGASLSGQDVSYDTSTNEVRFTNGAVTSWTSATFSARSAMVYKSTGTASTSPLFSFVDFGGTETVSSGTFTIDWDDTTNIIAKITATAVGA
jgi:hypothetical protein